MPTIFIVAFVAFLLLVLLIVLIAVVFFGARPSRRSTTDHSPSSGGSDYTSLNP
jgi:cbb3-type cytochrome oxidase subunit 3